jgi:hypothetical protein
MSNARLLAKKLLLALIATALGLISLELGARVVYRIYHQRPFDPEEVTRRLRGHSEAGTAPAEPEQEEFTGDDVAYYPVIIHPYFGFVANPAWENVNDYGFLGRAPFATRSPDTLIVGLFGGSVADHMFRASRDVLINALRADESFRDKRIEVFDLAVAAYKQPQQLLILTTLLALGAQFDIVVNLDGFNEIDAAKDNVQDGINPFYPYMWKVYAQRLFDGDATGHRANARTIRSRREDMRRWFARWSIPQSAFLLTLWDFLDQHEEAVLRAETSALRQAVLQSAATPEATGPPITFADDESMYLEFTEVWARSSLQMSIICAGMGIAYLQFLQPNQYLPGSKTLTAEEWQVAYDPDVADTQRVATGYPMLIERGRELVEQGVNFVDLTMIFKDEPRTVYRDTCCHFNALGNARLATEIARAITDHQHRVEAERDADP